MERRRRMKARADKPPPPTATGHSAVTRTTLKTSIAPAFSFQRRPAHKRASSMGEMEDTVRADVKVQISRSSTSATGPSVSSKASSTSPEFVDIPCFSSSSLLKHPCRWEAVEIRYVEKDKGATLKPATVGEANAATNTKQNPVLVAGLKRHAMLREEVGESGSSKDSQLSMQDIDSDLKKQTIVVEKLHVRNLLNTIREQCGDLSTSRKSEYRPGLSVKHPQHQLTPPSRSSSAYISHEPVSIRSCSDDKAECFLMESLVESLDENSCHGRKAGGPHQDGDLVYRHFPGVYRNDSDSGKDSNISKYQCTCRNCYEYSLSNDSRYLMNLKPPQLSPVSVVSPASIAHSSLNTRTKGTQLDSDVCMCNSASFSYQQSMSSDLLDTIFICPKRQPDTNYATSYSKDLILQNVHRRKCSHEVNTRRTSSKSPTEPQRGEPPDNRSNKGSPNKTGQVLSRQDINSYKQVALRVLLDRRKYEQDQRAQNPISFRQRQKTVVTDKQTSFGGIKKPRPLNKANSLAYKGRKMKSSDAAQADQPVDDSVLLASRVNEQIEKHKRRMSESPQARSVKMSHASKSTRQKVTGSSVSKAMHGNKISRVGSKSSQDSIGSRNSKKSASNRTLKTSVKLRNGSAPPCQVSSRPRPLSPLSRSLFSAMMKQEQKALPKKRISAKTEGTPLARKKKKTFKVANSENVLKFDEFHEMMLKAAKKVGISEDSAIGILKETGRTKMIRNNADATSGDKYALCWGPSGRTMPVKATKISKINKLRPVMKHTVSQQTEIIGKAKRSPEPSTSAKTSNNSIVSRCSKHSGLLLAECIDHKEKYSNRPINYTYQDDHCFQTGNQDMERKIIQQQQQQQQQSGQQLPIRQQLDQQESLSQLLHQLNHLLRDRYPHQPQLQQQQQHYRQGVSSTEKNSSNESIQKAIMSIINKVPKNEKGLGVSEMLRRILKSPTDRINQALSRLQDNPVTYQDSGPMSEMTVDHIIRCYQELCSALDAQVESSQEFQPSQQKRNTPPADTSKLPFTNKEVYSSASSPGPIAPVKPAIKTGSALHSSITGEVYKHCSVDDKRQRTQSSSIDAQGIKVVPGFRRQTRSSLNKIKQLSSVSNRKCSPTAPDKSRFTRTTLRRSSSADMPAIAKNVEAKHGTKNELARINRSATACTTDAAMNKEVHLSNKSKLIGSLSSSRQSFISKAAGTSSQTRVDRLEKDQYQLRPINKTDSLKVGQAVSKFDPILKSFTQRNQDAALSQIPRYGDHVKPHNITGYPLRVHSQEKQLSNTTKDRPQRSTAVFMSASQPTFGSNNQPIKCNLSIHQLSENLRGTSEAALQQSVSSEKPPVPKPKKVLSVGYPPLKRSFENLGSRNPQAIPSNQSGLISTSSQEKVSACSAGSKVTESMTSQALKQKRTVHPNFIAQWSNMRALKKPTDQLFHKNTNSVRGHENHDPQMLSSDRYSPYPDFNQELYMSNSVRLLLAQERCPKQLRLILATKSASDSRLATKKRPVHTTVLQSSKLSTCKDLMHSIQSHKKQSPQFSVLGDALPSTNGTSVFPRAKAMSEVYAVNGAGLKELPEETRVDKKLNVHYLKVDDSEQAQVSAIKSCGAVTRLASQSECSTKDEDFTSLTLRQKPLLFVTPKSVPPPLPKPRRKYIRKYSAPPASDSGEESSQDTTISSHVMEKSSRLALNSRSKKSESQPSRHSSLRRSRGHSPLSVGDEDVCKALRDRTVAKTCEMVLNRSQTNEAPIGKVSIETVHCSRGHLSEQSSSDGKLDEAGGCLESITSSHSSWVPSCSSLEISQIENGRPSSPHKTARRSSVRRSKPYFSYELKATPAKFKRPCDGHVNALDILKPCTPTILRSPRDHCQTDSLSQSWYNPIKNGALKKNVKQHNVELLSPTSDRQNVRLLLGSRIDFNKKNVDASSPYKKNPTNLENQPLRPMDQTVKAVKPPQPPPQTASSHAEECDSSLKKHNHPRESVKKNAPEQGAFSKSTSSNEAGDSARKESCSCSSQTCESLFSSECEIPAPKSVDSEGLAGVKRVPHAPLEELRISRVGRAVFAERRKIGQTMSSWEATNAPFRVLDVPIHVLDDSQETCHTPTHINTAHVSKGSDDPSLTTRSSDISKKQRVTRGTYTVSSHLNEATYKENTKGPDNQLLKSFTISPGNVSCKILSQQIRCDSTRKRSDIETLQSNAAGEEVFISAARVSPASSAFSVATVKRSSTPQEKDGDVRNEPNEAKQHQAVCSNQTDPTEPVSHEAPTPRSRSEVKATSQVGKDKEMTHFSEDKKGTKSVKSLESRDSKCIAFVRQKPPTSPSWTGNDLKFSSNSCQYNKGRKLEQKTYTVSSTEAKADCGIERLSSLESNQLLPNDLNLSLMSQKRPLNEETAVKGNESVSKSLAASQKDTEEQGANNDFAGENLPCTLAKTVASEVLVKIPNEFEQQEHRSCNDHKAFDAKAVLGKLDDQTCKQLNPAMADEKVVVSILAGGEEKSGEGKSDNSSVKKKLAREKSAALGYIDRKVWENLEMFMDSVKKGFGSTRNLLTQQEAQPHAGSLSAPAPSASSLKVTQTSSSSRNRRWFARSESYVPKVTRSDFYERPYFQTPPLLVNTPELRGVWRARSVESCIKISSHRNIPPQARLTEDNPCKVDLINTCTCTKPRINNVCNIRLLPKHVHKYNFVEDKPKSIVVSHSFPGESSQRNSWSKSFNNTHSSAVNQLAHFLQNCQEPAELKETKCVIAEEPIFLSSFSVSSLQSRTCRHSKCNAQPFTGTQFAPTSPSQKPKKYWLNQLGSCDLMDQSKASDSSEVLGPICTFDGTTNEAVSNQRQRDHSPLVAVPPLQTCRTFVESPKSHQRKDVMLTEEDLDFLSQIPCERASPYKDALSEFSSADVRRSFNFPTPNEDENLLLFSESPITIPKVCKDKVIHKENKKCSSIMGETNTAAIFKSPSQNSGKYCSSRNSLMLLISPEIVTHPKRPVQNKCKFGKTNCALNLPLRSDGYRAQEGANDSDSTLSQDCSNCVSYSRYVTSNTTVLSNSHLLPQFKSSGDLQQKTTQTAGYQNPEKAEMKVIENERAVSRDIKSAANKSFNSPGSNAQGALKMLLTNLIQSTIDIQEQKDKMARSSNQSGVWDSLNLITSKILDFATEIGALRNRIDRHSIKTRKTRPPSYHRCVVRGRHRWRHRAHSYRGSGFVRWPVKARSQGFLNRNIGSKSKSESDDSSFVPSNDSKPTSNRYNDSLCRSKGLFNRKFAGDGVSPSVKRVKHKQPVWRDTSLNKSLIASKKRNTTLQDHKDFHETLVAGMGRPSQTMASDFTWATNVHNLEPDKQSRQLESSRRNTRLFPGGQTSFEDDTSSNVTCQSQNAPLCAAETKVLPPHEMNEPSHYAMFCESDDTAETNLQKVRPIGDQGCVDGYGKLCGTEDTSTLSVFSDTLHSKEPWHEKPATSRSSLTTCLSSNISSLAVKSPATAEFENVTDTDLQFVGAICRRTVFENRKPKYEKHSIRDSSDDVDKVSAFEQKPVDQEAKKANEANIHAGSPSVDNNSCHQKQFHAVNNHQELCDQETWIPFSTPDSVSQFEEWDFDQQSVILLHHLALGLQMIYDLKYQSLHGIMRPHLPVVPKLRIVVDKENVPGSLHGKHLQPDKLFCSGNDCQPVMCPQKSVGSSLLETELKTPSKNIEEIPQVKTRGYIALEQLQVLENGAQPQDILAGENGITFQNVDKQCNRPEVSNDILVGGVKVMLLSATDERAALREDFVDAEQAKPGGLPVEVDYDICDTIKPAIVPDFSLFPEDAEEQLMGTTTLLSFFNRQESLFCPRYGNFCYPHNVIICDENYTSENGHFIHPDGNVYFCSSVEQDGSGEIVHLSEENLDKIPARDKSNDLKRTEETPSSCIYQPNDKRRSSNVRAPKIKHRRHPSFCRNKKSRGKCFGSFHKAQRPFATAPGRFNLSETSEPTFERYTRKASGSLCNGRNNSQKRGKTRVYCKGSTEEKSEQEEKNDKLKASLSREACSAHRTFRSPGLNHILDQKQSSRSSKLLPEHDDTGRLPTSPNAKPRRLRPLQIDDNDFDLDTYDDLGSFLTEMQVTATSTRLLEGEACAYRFGQDCSITPTGSSTDVLSESNLVQWTLPSSSNSTMCPMLHVHAYMDKTLRTQSTAPARCQKQKQLDKSIQANIEDGRAVKCEAASAPVSADTLACSILQHFMRLSLTDFVENLVDNKFKKETHTIGCQNDEGIESGLIPKEVSSVRSDPAGSNAEDCEKPAGTNAEYCKKPAGTNAEDCGKPAGTNPEYCKKPAGMNAEDCEKPDGTNAEDCEKPAGMNAEYCKKSAGMNAEKCKRPVGMNAEYCKKPAGMNAEDCKKPVGTNAEKCKRPAGMNAEDSEKSAGTNAEKCKRPAGMNAEYCKKPAGMNAEDSEKSAGTNAEKCKRPAGMNAEYCKKPAGTNAEDCKKLAGRLCEKKSLCKNWPNRARARCKHASRLQISAPTETRSAHMVCDQININKSTSMSRHHCSEDKNGIPLHPYTACSLPSSIAKHADHESCCYVNTLTFDNTGRLTTPENDTDEVRVPCAVSDLTKEPKLVFKKAAFDFLSRVEQQSCDLLQFNVTRTEQGSSNEKCCKSSLQSSYPTSSDTGFLGTNTHGKHKPCNISTQTKLFDGESRAFVCDQPHVLDLAESTTELVIDDEKTVLSTLPETQQHAVASTNVLENIGTTVKKKISCTSSEVLAESKKSSSESSSPRKESICETSVISSSSSSHVDYGGLKYVLSRESKALWRHLTFLESYYESCDQCKRQYKRTTGRSLSPRWVRRFPEKSPPFQRLEQANQSCRLHRSGVQSTEKPVAQVSKSYTVATRCDSIHDQNKATISYKPKLIKTSQSRIFKDRNAYRKSAQVNLSLKSLTDTMSSYRPRVGNHSSGTGCVHKHLLQTQSMGSNNGLKPTMVSKDTGDAPHKISCTLKRRLSSPIAKEDDPPTKKMNQCSLNRTELGQTLSSTEKSDTEACHCSNTIALRERVVGGGRAFCKMGIKKGGKTAKMVRLFEKSSSIASNTNPSGHVSPQTGSSGRSTSNNASCGNTSSSSSSQQAAVDGGLESLTRLTTLSKTKTNPRTYAIVPVAACERSNVSSTKSSLERENKYDSVFEHTIENCTAADALETERVGQQPESANSEQCPDVFYCEHEEQVESTNSKQCPQAFYCDQENQAVISTVSEAEGHSSMQDAKRGGCSSTMSVVSKNDARQASQYPPAPEKAVNCEKCGIGGHTEHPEQRETLCRPRSYFVPPNSPLAGPSAPATNGREMERHGPESGRFLPDADVWIKTLGNILCEMRNTFPDDKITGQASTSEALERNQLVPCREESLTKCMHGTLSPQIDTTCSSKNRQYSEHFNSNSGNIKTMCRLQNLSLNTRDRDDTVDFSNLEDVHNSLSVNCNVNSGGSGSGTGYHEKKADCMKTDVTPVYAEDDVRNTQHHEDRSDPALRPVIAPWEQNKNLSNIAVSGTGWERNNFNAVSPSTLRYCKDGADIQNSLCSTGKALQNAVKAEDIVPFHFGSRYLNQNPHTDRYLNQNPHIDRRAEFPHQSVVNSPGPSNRMGGNLNYSVSRHVPDVCLAKVCSIEAKYEGYNRSNDGFRGTLPDTNQGFINNASLNAASVVRQHSMSSGPYQRCLRNVARHLDSRQRWRDTKNGAFRHVSVVDMPQKIIQLDNTRHHTFYGRLENSPAGKPLTNTFEVEKLDHKPLTGIISHNNNSFRDGVQDRVYGFSVPENTSKMNVKTENECLPTETENDVNKLDAYAKEKLTFEHDNHDTHCVTGFEKSKSGQKSFRHANYHQNINPLAYSGRRKPAKHCTEMAIQQSEAPAVHPCDETISPHSGLSSAPRKTVQKQVDASKSPGAQYRDCLVAGTAEVCGAAQQTDRTGSLTVRQGATSKGFVQRGNFSKTFVRSGHATGASQSQLSGDNKLSVNTSDLSSSLHVGNSSPEPLPFPSASSRRRMNWSKINRNLSSMLRTRKPDAMLAVTISDRNHPPTDSKGKLVHTLPSNPPSKRSETYHSPRPELSKSIPTSKIPDGLELVAARKRGAAATNDDVQVSALGNTQKPEKAKRKFPDFKSILLFRNRSASSEKRKC